MKCDLCDYDRGNGWHAFLNHILGKHPSDVNYFQSQLLKSKDETGREFMKNSKIKRLTITETVDCDTDRLYASLSEAIKYLQEVKNKFPNLNISLSEEWTGYEDMHMIFSYTREETDEEFKTRLEELEEQEKRKLEASKKETARQELQNKIKSLQQELSKI